METNMLFDYLAHYGIVQKGHFLLTSGRHSPLYCNKDMLWGYPDLRANFLAHLCHLVIETCQFQGIQYKDEPVIVSPGTAGIAWGAVVADRLRFPYAYSEKTQEGRQEFRRGFGDLISQKPVIVVEDIVTTGGSALKTAKAASLYGSKVLGVVCLWDREKIKKIVFKKGRVIDTTVPVLSVINYYVPSYTAKKCPQCNDGIEELWIPKESA